MAGRFHSLAASFGSWDIPSTLLYCIVLYSSTLSCTVLCICTLYLHTPRYIEPLISILYTPSFTLSSSGTPLGLTPTHLPISHSLFCTLVIRHSPRPHSYSPTNQSLPLLHSRHQAPVPFIVGTTVSPRYWLTDCLIDLLTDWLTDLFTQTKLEWGVRKCLRYSIGCRLVLTQYHTQHYAPS